MAAANSLDPLLRSAKLAVEKQFPGASADSCQRMLSYLWTHVMATKEHEPTVIDCMVTAIREIVNLLPATFNSSHIRLPKSNSLPIQLLDHQHLYASNLPSRTLPLSLLSLTCLSLSIYISIYLSISLSPSLPLSLPPPPPLSLSLSLSHTHTHTHTPFS